MPRLTGHWQTQNGVRKAAVCASSTNAQLEVTTQRDGGTYGGIGGAIAEIDIPVNLSRVPDLAPINLCNHRGPALIMAVGVLDHDIGNADFSIGVINDIVVIGCQDHHLGLESGTVERFEKF